MILTLAQIKTVGALRGRWDNVGEPHGFEGDGVVLVEVGSDSTHVGMWIGIERDGYAHT